MLSRDELSNSSLFQHVYFIADDLTISKGFALLDKSRYWPYINFC